MPEHRIPTEAQAEALTRAAQTYLGPCTCNVMSGFGNFRTCAAHRWLTELDKRSYPIHRWERLLFIRATRERFQMQEHGLIRTAPPVEPQDPKGVLPW